MTVNEEQNKNDVAPELLERVQELFDEGVRKSKRIRIVKQRYNDGSITYADVNVYAMELGEILSSAYKRVITKDMLPDGRMYWNIADRVVGETMQHSFDMVEKLAMAVIKKLNEDAGIGMNAVSADRG